MKNEVLVVIPARGGSVRVPKKNIKMLNGKPLIATLSRLPEMQGLLAV